MVTKVTLEYDGSDFLGWARQPGQRTVQETLEGALHTVLGEVDLAGEPLRLTVAGRTDRGVHAWGQVASYRHEALAPGRLNGLLPDDVAVLACEPMQDSFDARADALSRTYCYRLLNRPARSVRMRQAAFWVPRTLDRELLHECAAALLGSHDFTAFTPTETVHVRFEREVLSASWRESEEQDGLLEFWIEADTFMRHMNRILIGTMLDVAMGRLSIEGFRELLQGKPRSQAGATAPAHGLTLVSVRYPG
ncbi:MAG TPA: tRNA pseudouridine(38-40) synthase TruA [Solirubrobacteraceae bacterium]|jgi:tRNA pseudouridine38-40 synthase